MATNSRNQSSSTSLEDSPEEQILNAVDSAAKVMDVKGSKNDPELSGRKAVIKIHQDGSATGKIVPYVAVNGHGYQIPRGLLCRVPVEIVDVLNNAVEKQYPTDGATTEPVDVPRYSFQLISMDPEVARAA